jgi:hypothetical protein
MTTDRLSPAERRFRFIADIAAPADGADPVVNDPNRTSTGFDFFEPGEAAKKEPAN